jgi:hypothetical protein
MLTQVLYKLHKSPSYLWNVAAEEVSCVKDERKQDDKRDQWEDADCRDYVLEETSDMDSQHLL